jgi:hypothetical protein
VLDVAAVAVDAVVVVDVAAAGVPDDDVVDVAVEADTGELVDDVDAVEVDTVVVPAVAVLSFFEPPPHAASIPSIKTTTNKSEIRLIESKAPFHPCVLLIASRLVSCRRVIPFYDERSVKRSRPIGHSAIKMRCHSRV